jgi:hypothetical protein
LIASTATLAFRLYDGDRFVAIEGPKAVERRAQEGFLKELRK